MTKITPEIQEALKRMSDPVWRLNNLYYIIDKDGVKRKFKLNWAQKELYENIWYANIILKARQLGISTFVCLLFLDKCLFNSNVSAGIIAHTREDAEYLFKRIKYAYDSLPPELLEQRTASVASARELAFNNRSSIRVGTSMRSSTLQYLHVSEFGKICAHFPDKAREIISGSLNTLGAKQYIFIESTAEGKDGHFYDLCKIAEAAKLEKRALTPLDYKFFFFPWWRAPEYKIEEEVIIPKEIDQYFEKLALENIELTHAQKVWYYKKLLTQREDMKREYPSTPSEAFESAIDGSYYAKWLAEARFEGRVGTVPWDRQARVYTAWDLGYGDSTAIVFYQIIGQEIHVIDYYENSGEGLPHYAEYLKKKPYIFESHFAPHDIDSHAFSSGLSAKEVGASLGLAFITLQTLKLRLEDGIEAVRGVFPRIWFDDKNCGKLIKCLEMYRKEYDMEFQIYKSRPVHDQYSHGADAFRYMAIAIKTFVDSVKSGIGDAEADAMYNRAHPRFE
jgi:hypothetical protein